MSEYEVYLKSDDKYIMIEIPEIYRDEDSETNTDQIKNYLMNELDVDFYSITIKIVRSGKNINKCNMITIENGDILYVDINTKYEKQRIPIVIKTGFQTISESSTTNINCNTNEIKNIADSLDEYCTKYKSFIEMILYEISLIKKSTNTIISFLSTLIVNSFKPIFYNILPMNKIKIGNDECVFFGKIDNNDNFCNVGFLYNITQKIYYEGTFSGTNIFNGTRVCFHGINSNITKSCYYNSLMADGQGDKIYIFNNEYFKGYFKNDLYTGKSLLSNNIGDYYGNFNNNNFEGFGKMKYKNGDIYTGYWFDGKRNLFGNIKYKNGNRYIGIWDNDNREEFGSLYNIEMNTSYIGTFINNEPTYDNDEFIIINGFIKNNNKFLGEMENCIKSHEDMFLVTHAKCIYNNDVLHCREFKNCKSNNLGLFKQYYYVGQTNKNITKNGIGRIFFNHNKNHIEKLLPYDTFNNTEIKNIYSDFVEYQCVFNDDKIETFGVAKFPNGSKYIGNFKNGNFHGFGKFIDSYGSVIKGKWNQNTLIDTLIF